VLEAGFRGPDDPAFVGVSDTRFARFLRVTFTTIDRSGKLTGQLARKRLLKLMRSNRLRRRKIRFTVASLNSIRSAASSFRPQP